MLAIAARRSGEIGVSRAFVSAVRRVALQSFVRRLGISRETEDDGGHSRIHQGRDPPDSHEEALGILL